MTGSGETRDLLVRAGGFALFNALLFAAFSVLWVKQYHWRPAVSDTVDHLMVPWLWLLGFFTASLCAIRRPLKFAILVSLGSAVVFAGLLFLFIHVVLVPHYDPMW